MVGSSGVGASQRLLHLQKVCTAGTNLKTSACSPRAFSGSTQPKVHFMRYFFFSLFFFFFSPPGYALCILSSISCFLPLDSPAISQMQLQHLVH